MIDLYTWTTPNGRKVSILLEELGVPYEVHSIDLSKDEQFSKEFSKISPNNKIPAIVDRETGVEMMETGAIMLYLSNKYGKFQCEGAEYWQMVEWLMWQMAGFGPMLGQVHHFVKYNKGKSAYAEERYSKEARRLYGVMDKRLSQSQYIAGKDYSIVDISIWPWTARFDWQEIDLNEFPNVARWYKEMIDRPAVQKGWLVPQNDQLIPTI